MAALIIAKGAWPFAFAAAGCRPPTVPDGRLRRRGAGAATAAVPAAPVVTSFANALSASRATAVAAAGAADVAGAGAADVALGGRPRPLFFVLISFFSLCKYSFRCCAEQKSNSVRPFTGNPIFTTARQTSQMRV